MAGHDIPTLTDAEVTAFYWTPLDKTSGCWEWMGLRSARKGSGKDYGQFRIKRDGRWVKLYAARVALALMYGVTPDQACHHCDNPPCVRPSHIYSGDPKSNSADKLSHGAYKHPRPGSRPDMTRRLTGRIKARGGQSTIEWSDDLRSFRLLDAITAADELRLFGDRLNGGRLPEILS